MVIYLQSSRVFSRGIVLCCALWLTENDKNVGKKNKNKVLAKK